MAEQLAIEHETQGNRGRYWARLDDSHTAEMTYVRGEDGTMVIDHTGVPRQFEGRGFALQLVRCAIEDAREKGFKIVPQCPYVAVQFRRHPDWDDLLA